MKNNKKAFTLIELLVVIAIIGILATISVIAFQNARSKSRDAKRIGDAKQVQTALELFFNDNNRYPTVEEWNTGKIYSTSTGVTSTYMQAIPTAPTPADGACTNDQNSISYIPTDNGSSYSISFCLGNTTGSLVPGLKCLTPGGILDGGCGSFVLNYIAGINGTISGILYQVVNYGGSGSLVTAIPNLGYIFEKWSDNNSTDPARFDTAAVNTTASFTCLADCTGRCSGDDGCGGSCPDNCTGGQTCVSGTCQSSFACGVETVTYNGGPNGDYNYPTVLINGQCWFKENLRTIKYNDGTSILNLTDTSQWVADITGAYVWYQNDYTNFGSIYGALYNFYAINLASNGGRNICPVDWHVPTDTELKSLVEGQATIGCQSSTGGQCSPAGAKLKEVGTTHWSSSNTGTNTSGFTALGAGARQADGSFAYQSTDAYFWSSSVSGSYSWGRYIYKGLSTVYRFEYDRAFGMSVRCLKD